MLPDKRHIPCPSDLLLQLLPGHGLVAGRLGPGPPNRHLKRLLFVLPASTHLQFKAYLLSLLHSQDALNRLLFLPIHIKLIQLLKQSLVCLPKSRFLSHRDHIRPVVLPVIPLCQSAPVKQIQKLLFVRRVHAVSLFSLGIVLLHIFAVDPHHPCRVSGAFHAPLDLQGVDACLDQIRDQIQSAEILHAEKKTVLPACASSFPGSFVPLKAASSIGSVPAIVLDFSALLPPYSVGKAAGLSAPPPISAPSADKTAQKALSRIAVTQRPMYKTFDLDGHFFMDLPDLLQRQLPGRHHPLHAKIRQDPGPMDPGNGHLGAGVNGKIFKASSDHADRPQILDNDPIQSLLIVRSQKMRKLPKLLLLHQRVDRHIKGHSMEMGIINGLQHPLLIKIIRVSSGSKPAADVNSVRPGPYGRLHAFKGARRSQNLHLSLSHLTPPFLRACLAKSKLPLPSRLAHAACAHSGLDRLKP